MPNDKSGEAVKLRSFRSSPAASSFRLALTPREAEILQLVADGLVSRRIAQRLSISTETIKSCLVTVRFKLDANNRTHAVSIAIRNGLIH